MENFMQICLVFLACIVISLTPTVHAKLGENARAPAPYVGPELRTGFMYNVMNFGAKGDGKTDDSKAFLAAFAQACQHRHGVMLVPGGRTFLLQTIEFMGRSCRPNFTFQLDGTIVAPQRSAWTKPDFQWILFSFFTQGLIIKGKGVIDGNGQAWWKTGGMSRPNTIKIGGSNHVSISRITVKNSPLFHIFIDTCTDVTIFGVTVSSPGDSPNTDGIHLTSAQHVTISNCPIAVGDDCVSMLTGVSDVKIHDVHCGPGHGFSIGALGRDGGHAEVHDVHVYNSFVSNAMNGVRIKTWQGGSGSVSNISFSNVAMKNVQFPIIIDQFYCPGATKCTPPGPNNIAINGVTYKGIHGTYANKPVQLLCNKNQPCRNLEFDTINLTVGRGFNSSAPSCSNAYGKLLTPTTPSLQKCLLPGLV